MAKLSSAEERLAIEIDVQVSPVLPDSVAVDRLAAAARATLRREGTAGTIALVVTDDATIQGLNRDFLGKDTPTDVLAFSAQEQSEGFVSAPEAQGYLGDVIISYPRAVCQAQEAGHSAEHELDLLVVHGVLHLLGYDHADGASQAAMWALQDEIIESLGPSIR